MSDARDRARSLRARNAKTAQSDTEPAEKPAGRAPLGANPKVRQTVDLTRERHKELAAWRLDTALTLGRTRLTTQDVLAATVDVLLGDEQVQRRVRFRLEEILEERDR